ncbi:MAG: helix-turn-helix transcriptional regulator [Clostridia bacterium]|nr:helix-turn-helix transcriptional regulator [Clostridia bacterium]
MENIYHINNEYLSNPLKFEDIYLVQLGRLFCRGGVEYDEHVHLNWYELTIVTGGSGTVTTGGVSVPVSAGDIYLSFPADLHQISSDASDPLKYDFFSFRTENEELAGALEKIYAAYVSAESRVFSDGRINNLVSLAINEILDESLPLRNKMIYGMLSQIIIYIIRAFDTERAVTPFKNTDRQDILCYQIMSYIDTHIFTLSKLSDLAVVMNYNYSYLSALFKKTTGRTLSDYYMSTRLKTARLLIDEGKLKISEIAELLNYSSIYVFSRAYKKKYGTSPSGTS